VRLTVLGSGSRGNALLVESNGDALLVDAGFSHKDLERRLNVAGHRAPPIRAIVLTHEHGDHARGAARAAATWSVPVAASRGTLGAVALRDGTPTIALAPARTVAVESFRVTAFPIAHDAHDPVMVVIEDGAGVRLGVAVDVGTTTTALRHALRGLDGVVIESNHDEVLLRASDYPPSVRARIAGHSGHLSNRQTAELLGAAAHAGLGLVVLAHLSELCNRADLALAAARAALRLTPFRGRLVVATQDEPTLPLDVAVGDQLSLGLGRRD
jgi:phosphoribosyl 1,2-cyclic phosphodiesterase